MFKIRLNSTKLHRFVSNNITILQVICDLVALELVNCTERGLLQCVLTEICVPVLTEGKKVVVNIAVLVLHATDKQNRKNGVQLLRVRIGHKSMLLNLIIPADIELQAVFCPLSDARSMIKIVFPLTSVSF